MCYTSCMAPQINTGDFDGMVISMNFSEHNPPHFHVDFQGQKVVVDIREGPSRKGRCPAARPWPCWPGSNSTARR